MQRGYIKKNGTYVSPHFKSKPDRQRYNNNGFAPTEASNAMSSATPLYITNLAIADLLLFNHPPGNI
jgi:folylpolyglutamate synthase/dihydropteroate synthase